MHAAVQRHQQQQQHGGTHHGGASVDWDMHDCHGRGGRGQHADQSVQKALSQGRQAVTWPVLQNHAEKRVQQRTHKPTHRANLRMLLTGITTIMQSLVVR